MHLQILEADRVRLPGHEAAVIGVGIAREERRVPAGYPLVEEEEPKLVHLLEVPRDRSFRPVGVEGQLALRAHHGAAGFEGPPRSVLEHDERPAVVLVRNRAGGVPRSSALVMRLHGGLWKRPLADERLRRRDDPGYGPDERESEIEGVAEEVERDAVAPWSRRKRQVSSPCGSLPYMEKKRPR